MARHEHIATSLPAEETAEREVVYVWDVPVRITHWVIVFCLAALSLTGYYIANPFIVTSGEASSNYLMGWMRVVHFIVAFIFTFTVCVRIYWAFVGNTYARWYNFIPVSRERWRELIGSLQFYLFLRRQPPPGVGHSPLAGLAYVALYILFVLEIFTGFALYSQSHEGGFYPFFFGWVFDLFAGSRGVRLIHHVLMWTFAGFLIHHLYSCILFDCVERQGILSSIFNGFKFRKRD